MSQVPLIIAGPNERAGFIEAPVKGPPARISTVTTRPIPKPATAEKVPLSSTAVPKIAVTRKNVKTNSINIAATIDTFGEID